MSMAFRATRRFVAAIKLARANAARYSATVADPKPSSAGSGRVARPTAVSSAMTKFSGVSEIPHGASITKIRDYIKASNLQGISTTRQFHSKISSESNIQPVPSPLTQIPAVPSKRTEGESSASRKRTVQAVLKRIKQSPKKVNLVAALVRGMRVEDALLQMQVTVKRAAKTVYKVIHSARANATHNHGLDADRLIVAEAFVGKGIFRKTLSYHAKGRCGIRVRPQCRLTVVLRELTPEEEAEIARLRVRKFRKLSKRERQLVPHKLLETKWQWHRTKKDNVVSEATMA